MEIGKDLIPVDVALDTMSRLQEFFDHSLLAELVYSGALRPEKAREIALKTAEFAQQISEEPEQGKAECGVRLSTRFERIASKF